MKQKNKTAGNLNLTGIPGLKSVKQELLSSLERESGEIIRKIPAEYRKKANSVLSSYSKIPSPAGMENFINAANEFIYFNDAIGEFSRLEEMGKFSPSELHDFFSIRFKKDFGEEDYRFLEWERQNNADSSLKKYLELYKKSALSEIITVNRNFTMPKKQCLAHYRYFRKNPKQAGNDNSFILKKTPAKFLKKLSDAENNLKVLSPDSFARYSILTDRIIIVKSKDLVSYSHFHEPGISYLNVIDRNPLELIDDLVHENAHHHMNLILKKFKIFKNDNRSEIFYSPWRDSLRPLYAILHATFTFSFGALLFREINFSGNFGNTTLNKEDIDRSRFRFIQETLSVEYSLFDLELGINNGYFTKKGTELISELEKTNQECLSLCLETGKKIVRKEYITVLKNHSENLKKKREYYKIISSDLSLSLL